MCRPQLATLGSSSWSHDNLHCSVPHAEVEYGEIQLDGARKFARTTGEHADPSERSEGTRKGLLSLRGWVYDIDTGSIGALNHVSQPGFKYSKAEVLLLDLRQPGEFSDDLFTVIQPAEVSRVMAVLDEINGRGGRGTLRAASVPSKPDWGMRREI